MTTARVAGRPEGRRLQTGLAALALGRAKARPYIGRGENETAGRLRDALPLSCLASKLLLGLVLILVLVWGLRMVCDGRYRGSAYCR